MAYTSNGISSAGDEDIQRWVEGNSVDCAEMAVVMSSNLWKKIRTMTFELIR